MKPSFRKRLYAWGMKRGDELNHKIYGEHKKNLFKGLSGTVLEIGPGTGINFRYLPSSIEWIGIEPNEAFSEMLMEKAKEYGIRANLLSGEAAHIPLPSNSVDAVLCTLVLCSVENVHAVISEIERILKTGGRLVFIEHVASHTHNMLRAAQNILNPLNRLIADGCNCNRETWLAFEHEGFSQVVVIHHMIKGAFFLHSPHIIGYVVK